MKTLLSEIGLRVRTGLSMLEWRALGARLGRCPLCGPTLFLRLSEDALGVRCLRCAGWPVSMAMARGVRRIVPDLAKARVYEASAEGPWVDFLRAHSRELVCSEYLEDVVPGEKSGGVLCQDLERLTFLDASFDLCTSSEVFEHVADDSKAFKELLRVLVPGGWLMFSVPLFDRPTTRERAERGPTGIVHRLEPEYHGDRIRGQGRVLVYREYGLDVVDRLRAAGFENSEIRETGDATGFGHHPRIIVARRPGD